MQIITKSKCFLLIWKIIGARSLIKNFKKSQSITLFASLSPHISNKVNYNKNDKNIHIDHFLRSLSFVSLPSGDVKVQIVIILTIPKFFDNALLDLSIVF